MPKYNIAVVGGRDFQDYSCLSEEVSDLIVRLYEAEDDQEVPKLVDITIVSGGARGADALAARYAKEHGYPLMEFLPDWDKHGRSAGFIRNQLIVNAATHLIAFWNGESKGTKHSIDLAKKKGIPIEIHSYADTNSSVRLVQ